MTESFTNSGKSSYFSYSPHFACTDIYCIRIYAVKRIDILLITIYGTSTKLVKSDVTIIIN